MGRRDPLLLNSHQFNREVARERIRATRRSFPFCIITLELKGKGHRRRRNRMLVRLLHRNLRMTDHKAVLGASKYAAILVDTPEMGGRSAMDRLASLMLKHNLQVVMGLRVHDPAGFRSDDGPPDDGKCRRGDTQQTKWLRVDGGGGVEVSAEEPIVPRPIIPMLAKRLLDIMGAGVGLVITSPLVLGAMLLIKHQDGATPIFTQTREGRGGKPFTIYKLRTMVINAEELQAALRAESYRDGPAFKIEHDPRVTRLGQFLRTTCIDELPQLWNVLKGDMSLVGPRPLPWHESRACDHWHRRRLDVRPGMTCYWQVNKCQVQTFDDWMRLDLRYLDQSSLLEDIRLIARTVTVPMTGRGSQ